MMCSETRTHALLHKRVSHVRGKQLLSQSATSAMCQITADLLCFGHYRCAEAGQE